MALGVLYTLDAFYMKNSYSLFENLNQTRFLNFNRSNLLNPRARKEKRIALK